MSRPLSFYRQLLTSQYQNSPKLKAFLDSVVSKMEGASTIADQLDTAFDVAVAVGVQLDMLGSIVGNDRRVSFVPHSYRNPVLDDSTYRTLLRAAIGKNHWSGKLGVLYQLWNELFTGDHMATNDRQDMSMDIYMDSSFDSMLLDLIHYGYIVPRPQGVQLNYYWGEVPFMGFDMDNYFIAGFDKGLWWSAPIPMEPFLGFDMQNNLLAGFDTGWWDKSGGVGFRIYPGGVDTTDDLYLKEYLMATSRDITGYDSLSKPMRENITLNLTAEEDGTFLDTILNPDTYDISGWFLMSIEVTPLTPTPTTGLTVTAVNTRNAENKLWDLLDSVATDSPATFHIFTSFQRSPVIDDTWTISVTGNEVSLARLNLVLTFSPQV